MRHIIVGAVAYAPQIVPIWDIIREYANAYFKDIRLDYVLFSNYERQVQWLMEKKIDIAWNTNVAYIRSQVASDNAMEAILMRDTDIGFQSVFVTRENGVKDLQDLQGKKFGLGSLDSAQAAIMPLHFLQDCTLTLQEMSSLSESAPSNAVGIYRFNSDVGKHGDTGRSEFDVLDKIRSGELDAGAIGSGTWARILQEGSYSELKSFYVGAEYCHCNFTLSKDFDKGLRDAFVEMMLSQNARKSDSKIAHMMSLEGLNEWVLCDEKALKGYEIIFEAMKKQNLLVV